MSDLSHDILELKTRLWSYKYSLVEKSAQFKLNEKRPYTLKFFIFSDKRFFQT